MSDDDRFLSRWSRRKRAAARRGDDEAAEAAADTPGADLPEPTEEAEPRSDAEILESLGLKDPDSLGPGDDFRAFMKSAVPEHLRRRALRRLWTSNPVLANLDGLNDYDGDFTGGTVAPGLLKTSYAIGRGFVRDLAEGTDAPEPLDRETATIVTEAEAETAGSCEISEDASESGNPATEDAGPGPVSRRRMKFRYET